jgi:hypothetical protein
VSRRAAVFRRGVVQHRRDVNFVPGAAGPGTFTATAGDTAAAADAVARALVVARSVPDTAAAADSVSRAAQTLSRATPDAAGASDTVVRSAQVFARAAADTAGASDIATRAIVRATADAAAANDTVSRAVAQSRPVSDTAGASDSITRFDASARTAADTAAASDTVARSLTLPRTLDDDASADDNVSTPGQVFPILAGTSSNNQLSVSSITTTFPTGTTAGDLCILYVARIAAMSTTGPTGWTRLNTDSTNQYAHEAWYRWYQAGDANPTVSGAASHWVSRMLRITGAHTSTGPELSSIITGSTATANPPSLDPVNWGTENTLWVAAYSDSNSTGPSSYPTSYTNGASVNTFVGPNFSFAVRKLAAASEDPGTFGLSTASSWRASTLAIRPAPQLVNLTATASDTAAASDSR